MNGPILTLKSSMNLMSSIPNSNMSIISLSKHLPIIRLYGRFLELDPNTTKEASFFSDRYSKGLASSNGLRMFFLIKKYSHLEF